MRNDRNQLGVQDFETKKEVTTTYWIQTPIGWFTAGEKESDFRLLRAGLRKHKISSCETRRVITQGHMYLDMVVTSLPTENRV
jgi:hypothetical protein